MYLIRARLTFPLAGKRHKQIRKHTDDCTDDGRRRMEWTCKMTLLCASFTLLLYSLAFVVQRCVCRRDDSQLVAYPDYSPENKNRMLPDPDKEVKKNKNIFLPLLQTD